jgi:hypothetical protein
MAAQVTIASTTLPNFLWQGDLQQLLDLFAQHLVGTLNGNVLVGQMNGSAPTSNIGVWVNGNVLYTWNTDEGRYLPLPLAIGRVYTGGVLNLTKIFALATTDRTLYTPDKTGTLAVTSDIFGEKATQSLGGTSPVLDWNIEARHYYITLSGNTTLSVTNNKDGQERDIWVENPASASNTFVITGAVWPGALPTQTAGGVNLRSIDHYKMWTIGTALFVERVGGYQISTLGGSGGDVTAPSVSDISHTNSGRVTVEFSELLQGASLSTADFVVKKGGVSQSISSASASGASVTLVVSTTFTSANSVTVQYTGSSIKDLAGNAAAAFGPSSSHYVSNVVPTGGGSGGGQNVP